MADKHKFEIEFLLKTSPKILYNMISTASGLSEWFADNVNVRDGVMTFFWDGSEERAKILQKVKDQHIRFQWEHDDADTYFEFLIKIDPITREVALIVTDFADDEEEEESARDLWQSQLEDLRRVLGA